MTNEKTPEQLALEHEQWIAGQQRPDMCATEAALRGEEALALARAEKAELLGPEIGPGTITQSAGETITIQQEKPLPPFVAATTPLQTVEKPKSDKIVVHDDGEFSMYLDTGKFEHMWRVATALAKSSIVPKHYQENPANCLLAVNMSLRLRLDPFMFMQKTTVINDKLGFEAQLIIAMVNTQKPFKTPVRYIYTGTAGQDDFTCTAWAITKDDERIEYKLSVGQARKIGNAKKNDNWLNTPELMITYRATTYLIRLYAPELLMGMSTIDELVDMRGIRDVTPSGEAIAPENPAEKLSGMLDGAALQPVTADNKAEAVYTEMSPPFGPIDGASNG